MNKQITKENNFSINQIVQGKVCGTFVILGFRSDLGDELHAQVKPVNPKDHTQTSSGEFALPVSALKELS
jgi:hypothetical protein